MSDFYGFEEIRFTFEGKGAVVVLADEQNRSEKWLLKTEYFGAFPELHIKPGGDHHPHGLPDNGIIAAFIERYYPIG